MQKNACRIPVYEERMNLILLALGQKRAIFVALVESERVTGQNRAGHRTDIRGESCR